MGEEIQIIPTNSGRKIIQCRTNQKEAEKGEKQALRKREQLQAQHQKSESYNYEEPAGDQIEKLKGFCEDATTTDAELRWRMETFG